MFDSTKVQVKAKHKIYKYAEGADPEKDEPVEVIQGETILTGEEAITYLNQLAGEEK
jgi:hypothetical protein